MKLSFTVRTLLIAFLLIISAKISFAQPANDVCANAVLLTSASSCSTTAGTVVNANYEGGSGLPGCSSADGSNRRDVWYKFVAQTTNPTITVTSASGRRRSQLFSGSCGSLTSLACSGAADNLNPSGLTVGQTYYIRVYSSSSTTTFGFDICITDPSPPPANDNCSAAISLTSSLTCSNTAGTLTGATYTAITGACGTNQPDVWYSFTAQSVNPTITISSGPSNSRFQIYSGTCGSPNNEFCSTSASQAISTNLTIGNTYFVRVYSNTGATGTFNICIVDVPPSNDACSGAPTLTSSTSCINTTGNVYLATNEAPSITNDCAGSVVYDVWYKFVAQTVNPTITLSNIGSSFLNPAMELLTGACGSQTAVACGTTSISQPFLAPGTTYYIRVYSSSGSAPGSSVNAGFDICVVDPVAPAPFNDDCANAINLPVWNTCNKITGNIAGATLSGGVSLSAPCTGTVGYDVWYKFTAVTNNAAIITLSGLGSNFTNQGVQVFSGSCGSLTPIACSGGSSVTTPALTTGNTYYVRVFSTSASAPNGNAGFSICATTTGAPVRSGNSYVNISKKTTGGVIEPGDTLEIRFTVNHTSGTMTNLRYVDDVPSHTTMLTGATDRIRIITNEGLAYKEYTLGAGDDAATYTASPGAGEYNIRMNVGFASGAAPNAPTVMTNASTSANGQMASSDKPIGGGGLLFATAYRVVVNGPVGDTVTLFPAQFIYNDGSGDVTLTATPFKILISDPMALCANNIGLNNAVENGGTFGIGTSLTRSTDLTSPIAGYTFVPDVSAFPSGSNGSISSVGDGRYSIVKNVSPKSSSYANAGRVPSCPSVAFTDPLSCTNRMFNGHWDVTGDHSGTSSSTGNAPPDLSTSSGYMLEVNADYVASEVYRQTINNLCPNTYYEFSAWVKNICQTCGIDSLGKGAGLSGLPGKGNGYPGVLPNLTFTLDNLDYYNTGEVDTLGWLKKGFVFKTDTGQTTATFSIRNNSQGGGGNDWALDDIAIATCLPTMQYSPSITPMICEGDVLDIYDTVSSYFNNYTNFKWQRSTNSGGSWADITAAVDTSVVYINPDYQFIAHYTIPPANTTLADSADLYRVIVATTSTNLANANCLFTDVSTIITLTVNDCGVLLGLDLLSFSGKINNNGFADLQWVTSKENQPVNFLVEKSIDGITFNSIERINGHGDNSQNNFYNYTDPNVISGKVWYRIAMYNEQGNTKYSQIILLNSQSSSGFRLNNVVNPFGSELDFEISAPQNSKVDAVLTNLLGKLVRKESFIVYEGVNSLIIPGTENLQPGIYILQVKNKDAVITKKVVKK